MSSATRSREGSGSGSGGGSWHLAGRETPVGEDERDVGAGAANVGGDAKLHLAGNPKNAFQ